jgi:GNAT superfamily N-acetyltransferase
MRFHIRPTRVPDDAAQVVEIMRLFDPEGASVDELLRAWQRTREGGIRFRLVAETDEGRIIATGVAAHDTWDSPERWFGSIRVHPDFRRQGVGSALLADLLHFLRENGGARYSGEIRDNDAETLRWLEARGGKIDRHLFESTLDLATFDERRFAGVVAAAEATGLRFFTLADEPGEKRLRGLYDLLRKTIFDIPGCDVAEFEPFEQWRQEMQDGGIRLDCQWLAADGDRIVGTTALVPKASGAMYTFHTSVDREYRGRGIALALKLLSIETARRYGAHRMRTNNDAENAPMLAVNR